MSKSKLPQRASLEYLKKLAKDQLKELRRKDAAARLAAAQLAVARDHGFPSWRALKTEVEKRQEKIVAQFMEACFYGDVDKVRALIAKDPSLVRAFSAHKAHYIRTGLHVAATAGHVGVVRLLVEQGADPNACEAGDNTYPLHWAAANGNVEIVRALLDAGGDVHGTGDAHEGGVIGWATNENPHRAEVIALLVERGARHHIFSAINLGDLNLIEKVVEDDPAALDRRMSRFDRGQTPLHVAINRQRHDILDLLIDLGADVEAKDMGGQTPMDLAMLRRDQEATDRLKAAGARVPKRADISNFQERVAKLATSTKKGVPAIAVPDIAKTLDWYTSIGFKELGRFEDDGIVNWGMLAFGNAQFMLGMLGRAGEKPISLWFYMENVDELYELFKARQLEFVHDIYDPFYGGREFSIRDLNGYVLTFYEE